MITGPWRKASASNPNGECVEVGPWTYGQEGGVAIRDSKYPDGPVLCFTHAEFRAFLVGAQAGEFNDLI